MQTDRCDDSKPPPPLLYYYSERAEPIKLAEVLERDEKTEGPRSHSRVVEGEPPPERQEALLLGRDDEAVHGGAVRQASARDCERCKGWAIELCAVRYRSVVACGHDEEELVHARTHAPGSTG